MAGMSGVHHHVQLLVEIGSRELFAQAGLELKIGLSHHTSLLIFNAICLVKKASHLPFEVFMLWIWLVAYSFCPCDMFPLHHIDI
jgi:hypothetical protein